ncbi:angiopoietin-4-like [Anopheles funestus]|uniref:angiopoietin-4-like n=1 Tax=Anopheles funestus TaxID=62324 RepID=UPI0020C60620|nr:angiopoietin-4-like [Anopheles funestus]
MALKVGLCLLCIFLVPVLCDESCFKRSESFLSKLGMEISIMEKGITELSAFTKDVVWNTIQMEMRVRQLKMEMEAFRQTSMAAMKTEKAPEPTISSAAAAAAAAASASAMAQATSAAAAGPSSGLSSNGAISSSTCSLQQLLQDQFKGNVLIEIKAAPSSSSPAEETVPIVKEKMTRLGDLESCSQANTTGIYRLMLGGNRTMDVLCDAEFDKGGWVVIQHRFNGSEEFYRNWTDYENGFGNFNDEFWLGNRKIYLVCIRKRIQYLTRSSLNRNV